MRPADPRRQPSDLFHRIVYRVGYRGYFLIMLGTVDVFQGLNFVKPGTAGSRETNVYLAEAIPFHDLQWSYWTWAIAWWVVGASCFINAFRQGGDHWGFLMALFIKVAFVVSLVFATANGLSDGIRRIVVWAVVASAVFVISRMPEPPRTVAEVVQEIENSGEIPDNSERGDDA